MSKYPFRDPELSEDRRIDDLLARMQVEEKIACFGTRPDVPRLGVVGSPHIEGYHGVAQGGPSNWGRRNPTPTTQFPQAYGLGSTWDPEIVERMATQLSVEARALVQNPSYRRGGLVVRAPNADLARDPRWGRTEEVYGEDAFHVAALAAAFSRGLQGDDERYWRCATLLKHFCANSNEDDRSRSSSNFDERQLREYYAYPFDRAIAEGGARAMMAAYNAINGTPAHVHPMLHDVVEDEYGLDGIICTDGGGLRLLVTDHEAFADLPAAAAACIKAGINQFLDRYLEPVTEAVQRGLLGESDLDRGLRGVFRVMIRLGLLDPPARVPFAAIGQTEQLEPWRDEAVRAFVREVTVKSIVLLENSAGLLPLARDAVQSLAVVGPRANDVLLDWYSGMPPYAIPPRDGIERVAGPGVSVGWVGDSGPVAVEMAASRDVAVVCIGNHPEGNASWGVVTSPGEGKEAIDRKSLDLPPEQVELVRRVREVSDKVVVVLLANFPFVLPPVVREAGAILFATHASQELGMALGDVIFGDQCPGGKLAQTWPASLDQLPPMMDYDLESGRTYQYFRGEPQYAFGYGLSYTRFELSQLELDADRVELSGSVVAQVSVENVGDRAGDEVVQLYVRPLESRVPRPPLALKGFLRVSLSPGEKRRVEIPVRGRDLAYYDVDRRAWALEQGRLELLVGTSSRAEDLKLSRPLAISPGDPARPLERG